MLQTAVCFQDNGVQGGGLNLIPRSASGRDRFAVFHRPKLALRVILKMEKLLGISVFNRIEKEENVVELDTKKGDLLIFNLQMDHKSTFPKSSKASQIVKYALFNTFGSTNSPVIAYQNYLKTRREPYYRFLNEHSLNDDLYTLARVNTCEIYY